MALDEYEVSKKRKVESGPPGELFETFKADADITVVVEGEAFPMHSQLMKFASPVFAAMLTSGMSEEKKGVISLEGKSKEEFRAFRDFLLPRTVDGVRVTKENVDMLLPWFDEYGCTSLKQECERLLMSVPPDVDRLLQAHRYDLKAQYRRCLEKIAGDYVSSQISLDRLVELPSIVRELMPLVSQHLQSRRTRLRIGIDQAAEEVYRMVPARGGADDSARTIIRKLKEYV
mmetsp:Transcript_36621/g.73815  ORF Transcript_36621/g.73815 Transcript_36621/m.73815 type:complete len:231 (-) Transcript_36621:219-911(-)